jgi:diguanylate cyclase (GGDEF)-like protein
VPFWNDVLDQLLLAHEAVRSSGILPIALLVGLCMLWARAFGRRSQRRAIREVEQRLSAAQQGAREQRVAAERAEGALAVARRALSEIPEIAHRLSATRSLREIPECALDLIEEIFDPSYAVFYRCTQGVMLAASARGTCADRVGERLEPNHGLIGFAALKQLPVTPEDADLDHRIARGRELREGLPDEGFSVCLPIVRGSRTLAVLLVGPCRRNPTQVLELGRMIALMTSVAITSTSVLKEQELLAQTDGLTGLLNKSRILHHLKRAIGGSGPREHLSVFLFDIDHFKHFNDTNGHPAGDDLLRSLGDLLKGNLREGEHVGRYGGEEFLLVMPGVASSEAIQAAERIRETIASHPFRYADSQPLGHISISGGVATRPGDGLDAETLVGCADEALYQAKGAGRDRVMGYRRCDLAESQEPGLPLETELPSLEAPPKEPPPRS